MKLMFRRREGTGAMYADNRRRGPRSLMRRLPRRSTLPRMPNGTRPWLQDADDTEPLDRIDLGQLVAAAREAAHLLLDLLEDVGAYVQRCRRWRMPMPDAIVRDMGDLLDWYVVLHTVGLVDRRGVWLGVGREEVRGAEDVVLGGRRR